MTTNSLIDKIWKLIKSNRTLGITALAFGLGGAGLAIFNYQTLQSFKYTTLENTLICYYHYNFLGHKGCVDVAPVLVNGELVCALPTVASPSCP